MYLNLLLCFLKGAIMPLFALVHLLKGVVLSFESHNYFFFCFSTPIESSKFYCIKADLRDPLV